jgi:hypothetical protein
MDLPDTPEPDTSDLGVELSGADLEAPDMVPDRREDAITALPYDEYNTCPLSNRVGQFQVELAELYTGVIGRVLNGVIPSNIPTVVTSEGDCTLYQPVVLFCDPPCVPGETCGESGDCIPYPLSQNVGTVTITGMEETVTMTPLEPGNFYTNPGTLPHPAFNEGADITLETDGGDYTPFTLKGRGLTALTSHLETALLESDSPLVLQWDLPLDETNPTQVYLELNIALHGGTPAWIACDVPDTGAFSISASMVTQLVALGYSGYPQVELVRRTIDAIDMALGCVEFEVLSSLVLPIEIPGLISCSQDEDCPEGQTCQSDLTCG